MNNLLLTEQFDLFYDAYVECACWVQELDSMPIEAEFQTLSDCMEFMTQARHLMFNLDLAQCGHDFYLTRNGHGAGFWDRGYEKSVGDELSRIARSFGEDNLILPQGEE